MAKKTKKRVSEAAQEPRKSAPAETKVRRAEAEVKTDETSPVIRNVIIVVLLLLGLYLLINFISGKKDQDSGDKAGKEESSKVEDSKDDAKNSGTTKNEKAATGNLPAGTTVSETDKAYTYTVGEGESYTTLARRAVAGIGGSLTPAERVAAETKLTTDAGADWLNVGQSVVLDKATVRAAVDWAKGLSSEEKAAWQPYADLVAW